MVVDEKKVLFLKVSLIEDLYFKGTQKTCNCSKPTIETLEKPV